MWVGGILAQINPTGFYKPDSYKWEILAINLVVGFILTIEYTQDSICILKTLLSRGYTTTNPFIARPLSGSPNCAWF